MPPGPPPLPESYRDCLDFLYARNQFAIKLGLDNIRALLERLGRPQEGLAFLHVAGTNGKGSVCANLAALAAATGVERVGLYTSPHLVSFRERIQVDGEPVPKAWIVEWLRGAMGHVVDLGATYFECVTAMALDYFRLRRCGLVVLETGLGGRLDATNVVDPAVTVISSVSLDHTEILGETVEAIWREKIAILKPGVPMVVQEDRPGLLGELRERGRGAGSPVHSLRDFPWALEPAAGPDPLATPGQPGPGQQVRYRGRFGEYVFPASLRPEDHQRDNLALSLLAMECFRGQALPPGESLLPFLRDARLPGRTQLLEEPGRMPLLLDGAHNPGGLEALARHVARIRRGRRTLALFAVMRDKDVAAMYRALRGFADEVLYVPLGPRHPRALGFAGLKAALPPATLPPASPGVAVDAGLREFALDAGALERLLRQGTGEDRVAVACGSLYLLGELIPLLTPLYRGLQWFRQFQGEES